ncbi:MAG: aconitate hydratase B, partial [Planctomycetes bacterium]|nr:aconitate hydratase B [Planctomycetota bacterium]
MDMDFKKMVEERAELGIPPLPLDAAHTRRVCDLLNSPDVAADTKETLAWILANRVPPGVNPAAKEKCEFLIDKLLGNAPHAPLNGNEVIYLLEHMKGGYSIAALIVCLGHEALAVGAADALANCILLADAAFEAINSRRLERTPPATRGLGNGGGATWFTDQPAMPTSHKLVVYRVDGEVNTDDLSPARHSSTRSDIPLHALTMGETRFPGGREAMEKMRRAAKFTGHWPVFVADTLGTGSSRKSATNSLV